MKVLVAILLAGFSVTASATSEEIPLTEQAFVDRIKTTDKALIVAQLGEPARAVDVTDEETGQVMGSIWHYHYLNTNEEGDYYKTTELDFIGDRVVTVIFSTSDSSADDTASAEPERIPQLECSPTC